MTERKKARGSKAKADAPVKKITEDSDSASEEAKTPKGKTPKRKRSLRYRIIRGILIALATPLVLLIVLLLFLHTGPGQDFLRERVVAAIQKRLDGGEVELSQLDFALGGAIELGGLRLRDADGNEVVALDSLRIVPDWGTLTSDPVVEEIAITGVRVHLVQYDDGTSNLKRLFKPTPPPPEPPPEPPEEKDRRIRVTALAVADVAATIDKPDGTRMIVDDFDLAAHADVQIQKRTLAVSLAPITLGSFTLKKPNGTELVVSNAATGLGVDVVEGAGTVTLQPTKAHVRLVQDGAPVRETDVDLEAITIRVGPGQLAGSIEQLMVGALALETLELNGQADMNGLAGEQNAALGLKVDAAKLNALLGREVLASDVMITTKLAGPPEAVVVDGDIVSDGAKVAIDGAVDAADPTLPGFDVAVVVSEVDTAKLLHASMEKVPPIQLERLQLGIRGSGRSKQTAGVDVGLHLAKATVKGYPLEGVVLNGRYEDGILHVGSLTLAALDQEIRAHGTVDLGTKAIDLHVTVIGDVGVALGRLADSGVQVKAKVPPRFAQLGEGALEIHAYGDLYGELNVDVDIDAASLAGGHVAATIESKLLRVPEPAEGEKSVQPQFVAGDITLTNVSIDRLLALRGKQLKGMHASLSGKISVRTTDDGDLLADPVADYSLAIRMQPRERHDPDAPVVHALVSGKANKERATLALDVYGQPTAASRERDKILELDANVPLQIDDTRRGVDFHRPLDVELHLHEHELKALTAYVPPHLLIDEKTGGPRKLPNATVRADVVVKGTALRPKGDVDIDASLPLLEDKVQRLLVDGQLKTAADGKIAFETALDVWLDRDAPAAITGKLGASVPHSPLVRPPGDAVSWFVDLDITPQDLQTLPIPAEKKQNLAGGIRGDIDLRGDLRDIAGTVTLQGDGIVRGKLGPLDPEVVITLSDRPTTVDVDLDGAGKELATLDVSVTRPGTGLVAALRDKTEGKSRIDKLGRPTFDATLAIPRQNAKAWLSALAPRVAAELLAKKSLANMEGELSGSFTAKGELTKPRAEGLFVYDEYATVHGAPGKIAVAIADDGEDIFAAVELGSAPQGEPAPVSFRATTSRFGILRYLAAKSCWTTPVTPDGKIADDCDEGAALRVVANGHAEDVDITRLVPAYTVTDGKIPVAGQLDWRLDADVLIDPQPRYAEIGGERVELPPLSPETDVTGHLALERGIVSLPGTKRQYDQVELRLEHDMTGVRLKQLSLHEADLEKSDRTLSLTAALAVDENLRPVDASARLTAKDWLVFGVEGKGNDKVGLPDAPRAALDADIVVSGDLDQPIKKIDVDVAKLALLAPDRFERAHQPEETHLGDVITIDKERLPSGDMKQPPGRMPVAFTALEPDAEDPYAAERAAKEAAAKEAADDGVAEPPPAESGLDVHVSIAKPIRVLLSPLHLVLQGAIDYQLRPNAKSLNGKLDLVGGDLSLGGRTHEAVRGHITLDNDCSACVDLLFARKEHNATLRDISRASGGETVNIHLQGPLSNRVTTLSGAGSPGTLFDLLSVHNAGRPRYVSQPGVPASNTAEFPQHLNLLMLSYLAVNVPNLLFLDKVTGWADPYAERGTQAYGRVRDYEAEGYNEDGDLRVRAVNRRPGAGQSDAELQLDYLFQNTPQTAVGVGVQGGSRLGGGPGVFFEWSSED